MYHIFFIHSSVDGNLDCVHVLDIVNNPSVNMGVHISFRVSYCFLLSSGKYLEVEFLDHTVVLFLIF